MPLGMQKLLATAAFLACAAATLPARAGEPRLVKGPYLQDLGSTRAVVKVEVDPPAPATLELTSKGDAGGPKTVQDRETKAMHVFRIAGLEPAQSYAYAVRVAGRKEPGNGTFTTAPKNDVGTFNFLVYGDNRTDAAAHGTVVRAMQAVPSDFLVSTGDYVEDGRVPEDWQNFFDIERPLLRDRCVFGCVGNHELLEKAGENYLRYLGPPDPAHLYGSFRWANARFFLLNGSDTFTDGPEAEWLKSDLARADNEPGLAWRFVVVHHGPWSAGPHGNNVRLLSGGAATLFAEHKIDLVLSGHDHIYERGEYRGIRYIVSGGGGAPLYPLKEPLASTRKLESVYHFIEINVAADGLKIVARRGDGSILERCGLDKATGWDCDQRIVAPAPTADLIAPEAPKPPPSPPASRCGCRTVGDPSASGGPAPLLAVLGLLASRRRFRYSRAR